MFLLVYNWASAQQLNMASSLPIDSAVRVGKLDNGLTYYLRHNGNPSGMADFYIVYNVGSIQETDTQTGLAHFLEHMAFNGTKNFPGNSMINWLESVGLQFGTNVNGATGMEMTYYNLTQVPLKRPTIIDSTLLILHDWSHYISLQDSEIDKERGVIIEERRQRNNASFRLGRKAAPYIYNKSRYADRDMIGSEEFLKTFSSDSLRTYYQRWYRPDLQAIVIVGDIDVDEVEGKIKKVMADIPAAVNPEAKETIDIPENSQPLVTVISDPEIHSTTASLYIKRKALATEYNNRLGVFNMNLQLNAAIAMANIRLADIASSTPAFSSAQLLNVPLTFNEQVMSLQVTMANDDVPTRFNAAYTELERLRRYGFTASEFEFLKTSLLRSAKYVYETSIQRDNSSLIWDCINNYTKNTPILSADYQWKLTEYFVYHMKLEEVNQLFSTLLTPSNNVLVVMVPEYNKDNLTTNLFTDEMLKVRSAELEPYKVETIDKPLLPEASNIKAGKVVDTQNGKYGSTVWTLNNGIKVIVKPTAFSPSQMEMSAMAQGGLSLVDDKDYFSASTLMPLVSRSGVGEYSNQELKKVLGTKVASVSPSIGRFSSELNGRAAKSDLESMLQLTYLYFRQPRFVRQEFDNMISRNRINMTNKTGSADMTFLETMNATIYGDKNNIRTQVPSLDALDKIDYKRMQALYNQFFCDAAGNYTFYFIGDIDTKLLKPLVEKYLGSLKSGKQKMEWHDDKVRTNKGPIEKRFEYPMETPQSTVCYNYSGSITYNQENTMLMAMLSSCLQSRYVKSIREDKGGSYGVTVHGDLSRQPVEAYALSISFKTKPAMVDELVQIVEQELNDIAQNGPVKAEMEKTLSFWKKTRPDGMKNNGAWLTLLKTYENWGEDWNTDFEQFLKKITPKKVQNLAQQIVNDNNVAKIIMDPAQ